MPKPFSQKKEKNLCSQFFSPKNKKQSIMLRMQKWLAFYSKVFWVLKIGQKKCPKSKTQNTFQQKTAPLLRIGFYSLYI
jgi:hypothetical protein